MRNIVVIEDNNGVDEIVYKIDTIKKETADMLSRLIVEKQANEASKRPQPNKYGYRLATKLTAVTRQLGLKTPDQILQIDNQDISDYFNAYSNLVAFYNENFDFPANKQDFCALMGITVNVYNNWLKSDDEDRVLLLQGIEDYFNSLGFHAGEVGNVNDKATMARMKIKDAGQGMVENNFQATITVNNELNSTPMELDRQLQRLLGGEMQKAKKQLK